MAGCQAHAAQALEHDIPGPQSPYRRSHRPSDHFIRTKGLRRRYFALAGRLTRSARRVTLHLPRRWPWATAFHLALMRLRAIAFAT